MSTPTAAELDAQMAELRREADAMQKRSNPDVPIVILQRTTLNGRALAPGSETRVPPAFAALLVDLDVAWRSENATPEEARSFNAAQTERRALYGKPENASIQRRHIWFPKPTD